MEREDEHRCATEYVRTRAPALAHRMVSANLRLVVKLAKGYRRAGYDLRDLVQEGNLGLVQAVTRYDPGRDVKLSSYAAWWIRAYLRKYTIDNWRLVKTGTTQAQRKLFFRLHGEQNKLEQRGVEPNAKQLAAALDVPEKDVIAMMERFAAGDKSMDAPRTAGESEGETFGDSLSAAPGLRPDVQIEEHDFARALHGKLKAFGRTLRGRESTIFRRRLLSDRPATLMALADGFGVTRERARQLEVRLKGRLGEYLKQELGEAVGAINTVGPRGACIRALPRPISFIGSRDESASALA